MPYSPDQLEFLSVHMGVIVPPQLLGKKKSEGKTTEPKKVEYTDGKKSLVALQQCRLAWDQARKQIQADLKELRADILAACQDDDEVDPASVDVQVLHTVLNGLDDRLIDKLDEALSTAHPTTRNILNHEAKVLAQEYMDFINGSALMADIDDSGFKPVAIRKSAVDALTQLSSKL